jgi:hypothetical protein
VSATYLNRQLTIGERRKIAHALRQLAESARYAASTFEPPPEMAEEEARHIRELALAEALDHERLAGQIERNGLRFNDPTAQDEERTTSC